MQPKERLLATLQGKPVDRPAVSFYELNGLDQDPDNPDPFNIFSHPSWLPAIQLAREKTDRMPLRYIPFLTNQEDFNAEQSVVEEWQDGVSLFRRTTVNAGSRRFTSLTRRDRDIDTVWFVEHLLKDRDDLQAWLKLPLSTYSGVLNTKPILDAEASLGRAGWSL